MTLVLVGLVALIVLFYVAGSTGPANVTVTLVGFTNDAAGARLATFSIANRSDANIVTWGYYTLEAKQKFRVLYPTIFGHYAVLAPGQSETVVLHPPETEGPWKVSIGYGRYNLKCRWALFAERMPTRIRDAIPERFRDVPKELAASDWIE